MEKACPCEARAKSWHPSGIGAECEHRLCPAGFVCEGQRKVVITVPSGGPTFTPSSFALIFRLHLSSLPLRPTITGAATDKLFVNVEVTQP